MVISPAIVSRKVLFVTSSLRTRWLYYSQALVARHFPKAARVVLDGRREWSPLGFLSSVLKSEADYIVHIDEDCFLLDARPLNELIAWMDTQPDVALAGTPDGGVPYRNHNPLACNLFFAVFKRKAVATLVREHPKWRHYRYSDEFAGRGAPSQSLSSSDLVSFDDYEPYYPFSWLVLRGGRRIEYLRAELNPRYWSTDVRWHKEDASVIARHMWWVRDWKSLETKPERECNRHRYERLERECLAPLVFGRHSWLAARDWLLPRLVLNVRTALPFR